MEPVVTDFRDELDGLEAQPAEFPLFSTVLGRQIDGSEMTADYWAQQICAPVRFHDAVRAAVKAVGADYLAEAGPRSDLLALARLAGLPSLVLCSGPASEGNELLGVAATLLRDGYSPDLTPLYGEPAGPLQRLPAYVFNDTSRFWFDGPITNPHQRVRQVETTSPTVKPTDTEHVHDRTEGEVLALIADVGNYSVTELARSKRLIDDLGYDSLLQLRLLDRLRTKYPPLQHVDVADLLPRISNVGDLVDFVVHRLDKTA
jgi:acyl transferase domain-containing protein